MSLVSEMRFTSSVFRAPQVDVHRRATVVRNLHATRGDDQGAVLSPEELEELEAAFADDQADNVVAGEEFLRGLRAPLDPSAAG